MPQTYQFYEARAVDAAEEAKDAGLDMLRERALRSEKAWRSMAERARKIEAKREKAEHARIERRTGKEPEAAEATEQG